MHKLTHLLKNPSRLSKIPELKYWLFVLLLIILIYSAFSSGDFSFLLTLSSLLSSLSFLGIFLQLQTSDSGLSKTTFTLYSFICFTRLCSILPYESYLPNDKTGDWLYQVIEICSFIQSSYLAYKIKPSKEDPLMLCIIPIVLVVSIFIHPTLNKNFFTDTCWMSSMVLDTFAVVPLLWKVKALHDLDSFSSHFIAAHSVSKLLSFVFWFDTYSELNKSYVKVIFFYNLSGYLVLVSQVGTLAFTGHFLWYYVKSAVMGTPFVLPI